MNNEERTRFEQEFPVPRNVWWNPEWCGEGRYEPVNSLLQRDSPESAFMQQQRWIGWRASEMLNATAQPPSSIVNALANIRDSNFKAKTLRFIAATALAGYAQDDEEPVAYPNCDTCGGSMDYMPWHYSTEFERHKHACDKCWPEVNPANPPSAVVPVSILSDLRFALDDLEKGFTICEECGHQTDFEDSPLDCLDWVRGAWEYLDKQKSAPQQPSAVVPEGWKLVPIEPDQWMRTQGEEGLDDCSVIEVWNRMVRAAPTAPKQGQGQ
jgi:hypothetical protein